MYLLAALALLATLFGFAGALGEIIYRARHEQPGTVVYALAASAFGTLVFLPSCLALPPTPWLRFPSWLVALCLVLFFSIRPARLPRWFWTPYFAYRYLFGTMLLIFFWSLSNGIFTPALSLGILAALAAALAWVRAARLSFSS